MKYLAGLFLPLFFTTNIFASHLCDNSCELSITFPDGGSIEVDRDLEIIFGEGGYITNNGVTTGFSEDDELEVESDEPIIFQPGGELVLGSGGNIKYSDMTITSNGVMNLAAIGGKKKVSIRNLSPLGDITLNMSSNFTVTKRRSFYVESGSVVALTDLVFKNEGYVYGQFVFGDAVLVQGGKETAFSGAVFLESHQKFKIYSVVAADEPIVEEPVIEEPIEEVPVVEPPEVVETPVVPVDVGGEAAASNSAAIEPAAYGSAGGFVGLLSLFTMSFLLLFVRRYAAD